MIEKSTKLLEARIGVEPTNKGFADLCLTTWLPRLVWVATPLIPRPARKVKLLLLLGSRSRALGGRASASPTAAPWSTRTARTAAAFPHLQFLPLFVGQHRPDFQIHLRRCAK